MYNAEVKGARLTTLLVDGVLALDASALTSSLSLAEQQKIKTILLTHHHFDHTRDLVTFGANSAESSAPVEIYALQESLDVITTCLLDGKMYADFLKLPSRERPFLQLRAVKPFQKLVTQGYRVLPVPVRHAVASVGFQVTSKDGKRFFYTGDTGPVLASCWEHISPQLLLIEVSGLNMVQDHLRSVGHLSLQEELMQFRRMKGYLPRIVVVHTPPQWQQELEQEIADVSRELGIDIEIGYDGMRITL